MTESSKPPSGRRMKARAPPPPQAPLPAPRHIFRNTVPDGGGTLGMDTKENVLKQTVDLQLTLPQGYKTSVTEDGSKALMDLLVELCSRYHLNPALHTLELVSPEGHTLGFKPNALLGSLNVACVLIKEKVWEEKVVRRPAPKVPEKTVRLMVNYHGSQKAVVRVNPLVPLQGLIPLICDKCEFNPAHVLLLKDSISRHELQLDKSLTELGIKELYVHDQSLVLQPKMASAPALNYSDSVHSSTASLGRAEKKGLLGIFQFSRRKTKGLSTTSGVSGVEDRPSTLGQSQSVMNIPRMSPKAETKKRRAPALPGAPTPTMGHTSLEVLEIGLSSESQQRKRKAPAPPPTPASTTPGPDDTSTSVAPTPDSYHPETPNPAARNETPQSNTVPATTVVMPPIKPVHFKTATHPPHTPSSLTPSSSSTESLAVQDSSSELSHSLEDSDVDLDQAVSYCSTLTSSTASGSVLVDPTTKNSSNSVEVLGKDSSRAAKLNQEATSASSARSEEELNLKLDDTDNNRHSTMGAADRPAPPKPRRSPAQEQPQLVLPPIPSSPPIEPTESSSLRRPVETEEAAPQSWLHSMQSPTTSSQKPESQTPEEETLSLGSSGGSSLPDQGYAASEGMAEGEDSGMLGSPSNTQPTSPDGSLSLDGSSGGGGERLLGPVRDNSSDSDEGCATWGSRRRHNDIYPQTMPGKFKEHFEDDPELTAQLHQTLADFEADLADQIDVVSAKATPYTMSTESNEVPVSVVDMDVPVTAIDEILEDYERHIVENDTKSLTTIKSGSKDPSFCSQSSVEPQNKNNNACTAADSNKCNSTNTKKPGQHRKSLENKSVADKKDEKMPGTKMKERGVSDTNGVKEDKQKTPAVNANADQQKHSNGSEVNPGWKSNAQCFKEKKSFLPPTRQRSLSAERDEETHRVNPNVSPNTSHGITCNATSRFGTKTFTVIPPKPAVLQPSPGESALILTVGAIKIDDQGNMVKRGFSRNNVGGSSETGSEEGLLLGKAKAFWSSNERQESYVPHSKDLIDKAKESTDGLKSTPTAIPGSTLKSSMTEDLKTTQTPFHKHAEVAQPKEIVKEEAKETVRAIKVAIEEWAEVESKISVSKNIQQPSSKPAVPPPALPDLKRDLSFLKPSRRTSSQYVASAINKYTPKHQVQLSANPNSIPNVHDSSAFLKSQTVGFQRSGRSIHVNPHQSSQSSLSDYKENNSYKSNLPGPKRSMSFPEYVSESQRDFGQVKPGREGFESCIGSTKESSNTLGTETAQKRPVHLYGPTQKNIIANNDSENIKPIQLKSRSPTESSPLHSSAKPPTVPQTVSHGQSSNMSEATKAATHLKPDANPQSSGTVSANVTVFGPVKKFRPVISRSVEKNTSLHSSLMEAIQTGGGRERLKKLNTSGLSSMKKASYAEEENERSALLAAIRAKNNSGRLRKTKSEAAEELEKIRAVTSEQERSAGPPSSSCPPSLTCTSRPVFAPLPPAPMLVLPPPPPALPQGKPSTVVHPNAKASMNPALVREAMLEAIRSGSAAERLKKVAAPTNTVQVNGRLGTIQATSSTLPQQ